MKDYLPILIILLAMIIIVIFLFYFYFNFVKISDKCARKIEIWGYGFLILVIAWEFIIKNILMGGYYNADIFCISEKLNDIYMAVTDNTRENISTSDFLQMAPGITVERQIYLVNIIESVLQIFSTIGIAIGRVQDLKNYKVNN